MPELPDLTIFVESLQKIIINREITGALFHKKPRLNISSSNFNNRLKDRKIIRITRIGKEILFSLDSGDSFSVHLMLSGGFAVAGEDREISFTVMTLNFKDTGSLFVIDPKGWVKINMNPDLNVRALDALDVTSEYLQTSFEKKQRMNIKAFLLDQQIIGGIGNAYSDEILWHARISPKSVVGGIPPEVAVRLADSIKTVLVNAIEYLRKNHTGILSGEVRNFLAVHNPKIKTSPTGYPVLVEQIASKKTYYTEEQVLY